MFLNNVTHQTYPTRIAASPQNTLYHSYHSYPESRFRDEYVERNYRVVDLTGPAFSGFIIDTNAIHSGNPTGRYPRDYLLLEVNARKKSMLLPGAPCGAHEFEAWT